MTAEIHLAGRPAPAHRICDPLRVRGPPRLSRWFLCIIIAKRMIFSQYTISIPVNKKRYVGITKSTHGLVQSDLLRTISNWRSWVSERELGCSCTSPGRQMRWVDEKGSSSVCARGSITSQTKDPTGMHMPSKPHQPRRCSPSLSNCRLPRTGEGIVDRFFFRRVVTCNTGFGWIVIGIYPAVSHGSERHA